MSSSGRLITSADIIDGTIAAADLGGFSVTTPKIADGAVTAAKLAAGTVPVLLYTTGVMAGPTPAPLISPIPAGFSALELRVFGRVTGAVVSEAIFVRPNGDSGANYYGLQQLAGTGSAASAAESTGLTYIPIGLLPGAGSSNSSWVGYITASLPGYSVSGLFKPVMATNCMTTNITAGNGPVRLLGGQWALNSVISSLSVGLVASQFAAGSSVSLYGLP